MSFQDEFLEYAATRTSNRDQKRADQEQQTEQGRNTRSAAVDQLAELFDTIPDDAPDNNPEDLTALLNDALNNH